MSEERNLALETEIGKEIRNLRNLKDWQQGDLAAQTGLSQGTISGLENGAAMNMKNLKLVAKALSTTVTEIVAAAEQRCKAGAA